ncbi:hypothetical protein, partial [Enterobacter cloacae complex sp. 2DZ2F20B]|uniref:hypothetical protein n=1 Tax=Enterobacter cloacae complex sp. 2DZ2F20B TaxID=2511993 RepID=UPI001CA56B4A
MFNPNRKILLNCKKILNPSRFSSPRDYKFKHNFSRPFSQNGPAFLISLNVINEILGISSKKLQSVLYKI